MYGIEECAAELTDSPTPQIAKNDCSEGTQTSHDTKRPVAPDPLQKEYWGHLQGNENENKQVLDCTSQHLRPETGATADPSRCLAPVAHGLLGLLPLSCCHPLPVHNNKHVNRKGHGRGVQYARSAAAYAHPGGSSTCLQSGSLQQRCMLPAPPRTSRDPTHTPTISPELMPKPTAACRSPGSGCQRESTRL